LVAALAAILGCAAPAAAATGAYAPLDQPGPALSVPLKQLEPSLYCEPSVRDASKEPVLLNPATGVTPEENYSWNWEPALTQLGIPWCAYTAPYDTLGDIQTSGEYLVYAIRTMYAIAGRPIAIIGHSQGGMSMRWPLRFWPDTRKMVDDVIGFSGSNHGTTALGGACDAGCPPADWQQAYESNFIRALNSYAETFPGISYTEVYSHTDEVVDPANNNQDASAALHTGGGMITNIATQDICPNDLYEHLTIGTIDPVAYALAVDALTHAGSADPARISKAVCSQLYMPGVNPLNVDNYLEILDALPTLGSVTVGPTATLTSGAPVVAAEPPLDCYVFATCAPSARLRVQVSPKRGVARRRMRVRVRVTVDVGGVISPVPGARVRIAGRRLTTSAGGTASTAITFRRHGRAAVTVTATEFLAGAAAITIARHR
jgi:hypothetical protein